MKTEDPEDENSCDEHSDDRASVKRFRAFMRDLQPSNTDGTISIRSLEGIIGKAIESAELRTLLTPDPINQISTDAELGEETDQLNTTIFNELGVDPAEITEVDFTQDIILARNDAMAPPTFASSHIVAAARNVEPALRFGPFRDRLHRDYLIELLQPVKKIAVRSSTTATPLLLATKAQLPASLGTTINLRKGTIWIAAKALDASAPSNGYIGLKIEKGTLEFSATPSRDEDDVILAAGDQRVNLSIELEQSASSSERATAEPPKTLNIKFSSNEATVGDFNGTAKIDSIAFEFKGDGSARHDDRRERIVFGCTVSPTTLDTADLTDAGASFKSETQLSKAGWGIPITTPSDPAELGEAAGQHVWVVELSGEFTAHWQGGPTTPVIIKEAQLVIQNDAFAIDVSAATPNAKGDLHRFNLWRLPGSAHRQRLDVHLEEKFEALFGWSSATGPVVVFDGVSPFLFDRPVTAVGKAASIGKAAVTVHIFGEPDAQSLFIHPRDSADPTATQRQMLVLENAYLAANTLKFGGLASKLRNGTDAFDGFAGFIIPVFGWIPILPDPYVDNLCVGRQAFAGREASSHLLGLFAWGDGEAQFEFYGLIERLSASLCKPSKGGSGPMRASDGNPRYDGQTQQGALIPQHTFRRWDLAAMAAGSQYEERKQPQSDPSEASLKAQKLFHDVERRAGLRVSGPMLLDVSTARHQIGVQLIHSPREQHTSIAPTSGSHGRYVIYQSRLGAALSALRVFALPQIQWEPVRTLEKDQDPITLGIFPTPLASPDDGGATVIGSNTASLAPVIPDLTLNEVLRAFDGGQSFGVVTTLPFGMKALFRVRSDATAARLADTAEYVRPCFDTPNALAGGLQLSIRSEGGALRPGRESPSFEGLAVQTLNGVDLATGTPLNISVLGATAGSDGSVETLFNTEFSDARPRAPLTRYDISGYGASTFSDWANPKGSFAETTRAQFQVMVGRTALEVVKVASIIYPWGIRVTRSVTIERKGGGGVLRRDSGWQAQSSGVFDFTTDTQPSQPFEIHPGLIRGVFNAMRIRPLANDGIDLPGGGKVLPMAFDADVELDGRIGGGLTPVKGLVGYLHLEPTGEPISKTALAALIAYQGAIGGPVDTDLDVAGSGFKARALRIEIDGASSPGGVKFVGAVRTTPRFGAAGSWSVAHAPGPSAPPPYDAKAVIDGAPIIREGAAQPSPDGAIRAPMTGPYRFADARDLFAGASPENDYGFIQSDTTHRFLFRRPKIEPNTHRIVSDLSPVFADFFAATSSKGLFPPAANGIELTDKPYRLDIDAGTGFLALTPDVDLASPRGDLVMSDSATDQFRIAYGGSDLRFSLSPTDWSLDFDRVELWTDAGDWPELNGTRVTLRGGEGRRSELDKIETLMSPVLENLFSILPFMNNRGVHGPVDLGASNLKVALKFSAGVDAVLEDPSGIVAIRLFALLEMGIDNKLGVTDEALFLGGKTGYEARFSIPIEPYPIAVIFGWGITLGGKVFLTGPDAGKSKGLIEVRIYVGLAFGKKLGPFEATVATGAGLLIVGGSESGLGGFIFLEIKAKITPIVAIKVFGEFSCLQIEKAGGDKYHRWSGQVGINVSIFMIISIKFTADVSDEKKID